MKAIKTYATWDEYYENEEFNIELLNFDISIEELNELLNKLAKIGYYDNFMLAYEHGIEIIEIPDEYVDKILYVDKIFNNTKKTKKYMIYEEIEYKILMDEWHGDHKDHKFGMNETGLNSYNQKSTLYGEYQITKLSKQDMMEKIQTHINKIKEKYNICMNIEKEYLS